MTKHGAEPRGRKGLPAVRTLENEEKKGRAGIGSFETQVAINHPDGLRVEGEEPLPVSLPSNQHFVLSRTKVIQC
jgi:hypothetical protein